MPRRILTAVDAKSLSGTIIEPAPIARVVADLDAALELAGDSKADLVAGGAKIARIAPIAPPAPPKADPIEGVVRDVRALIEAFAATSGAHAEAVDAAGRKIAEIATVEPVVPIDLAPAIEAAAARIEAALRAQADAVRAQADAMKLLAARLQPPKVETTVQVPDRARPSYAVDIERDRNGMIRDLVIRPLAH